MNKNTILILIILSGVSQAKNSIKPEVQHRIKADIALVHSVKQLEQSQGSGGYLRVGADSSCNGLNSIQAAIDLLASTGHTEIRVARNKTYNENLIINDLDVSIIGGYFNCFNMALPGGPGNNQSVVDGGDVGSVLTIQSNSQRNTILLKNLVLTNGTANSGGGLKSDNANAVVSLTNVDIKNNVATFGGGIAIFGNDTDISLINSRVSNNTAKLAGGIYCSGANSSLILTDQSGITSNHANGIGLFEDPGHGAGAYIDNCYFAMYSGSASDTTIGIVNNSSSGKGGGIYAVNNAVILLNGHENCDLGNCIGDDINPVNVTSNRATSGITQGSGGGIYTDTNASITIYAGLINLNVSSASGGGIYIVGGALEIGRIKKDCWNVNKCNYIDGNFSNLGGALFGFGSEIDISLTTFENNLGTSVLDISDTSTSSKTRIEGSIFNNNGNQFTESIVQSTGGFDIEVIHSTFADNNTTVVFSVDSNVGDIPVLQIHSSIIDNFNTDVLSHNLNSFEVNISNIIANEILSLSTANGLINQAENFIDGPLITLDDPMFVDRNNRDYHLSSTSPAIDYAHTPERISVNYPDMDFESRGFDDPNITGTNFLYHYDLGADEFYAIELIFKDGFEN